MAKSTETLSCFIKRVEDRTGLRIEQIPDGEETQMMEGPIICNSTHGVLIYLDFTHEDEEGRELHARCVLIRKNPDLPEASSLATGYFLDTPEGCYAHGWGLVLAHAEKMVLPHQQWYVPILRALARKGMALMCHPSTLHRTKEDISQFYNKGEPKPQGIDNPCGLQIQESRQEVLTESGVEIQTLWNLSMVAGRKNPLGIVIPNP